MHVLTQFLSNWSHHVEVDGCHRKLVNVMSGVPLGRVLGLQLFLRHTAELFSMKVKGKVFYGKEAPSGESTTTECGVNY